MRMQNGLTATFKVNVSAMALENLRHADIDNSKKTYYAIVKFGKKSYDYKIYETATNKIVWGYFPLFSEKEYFTKDLNESNEYNEVYSLTRLTAQGTEELRVTFTKEIIHSVALEYGFKKKGEDKYKIFVMGFGDWTQQP
jgi:hypothetical protein